MNDKNSRIRCGSTGSSLEFKVLIEYGDYVDVHKFIQIVPNCNFSADL